MLFLLVVFLLVELILVVFVGVLSEILEPIMGKGLIPADFETWKKRRKAIVPAFHKKWLERMVDEFEECSEQLHHQLDLLLMDDKEKDVVIDMEEKFCSVSLDIIGKCVFNYEFGSVTSESPIIQAVYNTLREAEHRSTFYFPYWNIPGANFIVPRQRKFQRDLFLINKALNELILNAIRSRNESDLSDLEARDYSKVSDASLLRFLVDLRGEEATDRQLRDDLMTMLVAGHETTAAVLTWALFCVAQSPSIVRKLQEEVDLVLGNDSSSSPPSKMSLEKIKQLNYTRYTLAESLRMFPEPPVLIRRCLQEDELPLGGCSHKVKLQKGTDIFISVWNLHRSPQLWKDPDVFNPDRWEESFQNEDVQGWNGYRSELLINTSNTNDNNSNNNNNNTDNNSSSSSSSSLLYPNEVVADFAFLPFGGGSRKCVGDSFAIMEATVVFAKFIQCYTFEFANAPVSNENRNELHGEYDPMDDVGMVTGATIHTKNGLKMKLKRRN